MFPRRQSSPLPGPGDVDNSHSPALIPQMADRLRGGYDVVIASR